MASLWFDAAGPSQRNDCQVQLIEVGFAIHGDSRNIGNVNQTELLGLAKHLVCKRRRWERAAS
jgi:hypothetical protein